MNAALLLTLYNPARITLCTVTDHMGACAYIQPHQRKETIMNYSYSAVPYQHILPFHFHPLDLIHATFLSNQD
jgi:hypothetical protein